MEDALELYNVLGVGIENAIRQRDITDRTGFNSRTIRVLVNMLRKDGYPICSGNNGYWIAKDEREISMTIARMKHEAEEIYGVIDYLKEFL
jgi:biotin operon repressor